VLRRAVSQVPFEELGAYHPEGPVGLGVLRVAEDQVRPREAGSFPESGDKPSVEDLFLIVDASLLGDQDDDHLVRALKAESCILGDYPAGPVFLDHLTAIPIRCGEYVQHYLLCNSLNILDRYEPKRPAPSTASLTRNLIYLDQQHLSAFYSSHSGNRLS
jgi:hypothetical protein